MARAQLTRSRSTALDSYVAELGNDISYDKSLSSSRFLKTILARHKYGPIVLKIFIKPDSAMSLRVIQRRLKTERDALTSLPNVNTYQTFVETEKAGYLIRQWIGSNLYDRVSQQPYLAGIEKKWIAFQLLTALRDARNRKASALRPSVAHGDVKSENILLTTSLTVLLTDFSASFKPTFLPLDDPSDFSFFFDTSGRRTCYIAPERFYTSTSRVADKKRASEADAKGDVFGKRDGRVTEEMDVFSAGCVLAEMWTDGRTVFNLSELYAYKDGSLGLEGILDHIEDGPVRDMISQMLARDPPKRPSFDLILSTFREIIFPEYFYTFLEDYFNTLNEVAEASSVGAHADVGFPQRSAGQSGTKVDKIWDEWESISTYLGAGPSDNGPALLILNMITSSVRHCLFPSSRLHALKLFVNLLPFLLDEDKVDRVIPYIVELLSDDIAVVRAEACQTLVEVVDNVETITPQNATFIPEYLLPQMRHLATDNDTFVRASYATGLVKLANAAVNMLEMSQAAKGSVSAHGTEASVIPDYDSMLLEIQSVVEEQATTLLVDPSPYVKRAMLSSISDLCLFFGRQKSNETVLSHIMTYLNDKDWMLRLAFFDGIVGVGAFIGLRAVEEYVLPLMFQALADPEEAVVARVLYSMASLASLGLLARMRLWDVFFAVKGFLFHPNTWIRQGAVDFIATASRNLPISDVWCVLYPNVRPMLHSDISDMTEASIVSALLPPLPRGTLTAAKAAALQNTPAGFWQVTPVTLSTKVDLMKSAQKPSQKQGKLQDRGISATDEVKIEAMKEFIVKQAYAARAREGADRPTVPEVDLASAKSVSLTDLGVTPQTVFISPRTVGVDSRDDLRRLPSQTGIAGSRRTSFASKSNRGPVENPLEEIRKKLAALEPISRPETPQPPGEPPHSYVDSNASPSESGLSSTLDIAGMTRNSKRKVDSKAAPAIGASRTNAVGMTTIHDDPMSGRTTPNAAAMPQLGTGGASTPKATAPYASSYEGHDPGVRAFLEQIDLDNYREPLLDFGPKVTASHKKRSARVKSSSSSPQGVTMIAHLTHHEQAITSIVTSPDSVFFATSSEDCQILIWDTARLERSVTTKPRQVYRMDAPISTMCRIENTHCLAAASEDGQLHVLRVHVSGGSGGANARYEKVERIRSWRAQESQGHVKHVSYLSGELHLLFDSIITDATTDSSLLLITSTFLIAILDIRSMSISKSYQHPLDLGIITAVCPATHWLVLGTSTGVLSLWDLRFGLLIKSWAAGGAVTACKIHPARGRDRWIMVSVAPSTSFMPSPSADADRPDEAVSRPLVEVYDLETSRLVEVYEVRSRRPGKNFDPAPDPQEVTPDRASLIAELAKSPPSLPSPKTVDDFDASTPLPASPRTISDLIVGQSWASLPKAEDNMLMSVPEIGAAGKERDLSGRQGWMISAGEDRAVRYWDLVKVQGGFVVCGSQKEKDVTFRQTADAARPTMFYTLPNVHRQGQPIPRDKEKQVLRPHYDAIAKLGTLETPFSSCVISGDRSGVVKVWRMEGAPTGLR
ncbi:VPS15 protein kinase [Cryptococcus wingfieldii CBS 7118]|uniref:non-specific serine/threonine protein kinase n=1 Tax=Cryptococcus wingfieldii CBS 7118 TaxID=1295528 RepID=A0A1E3JMF4_9TREE|nr:VPS15 protein kinase [Cryptococcus wingfieldii CBS 7118]ODO02045.1 VPS15 protein kinase [Cryptococcus wingfieldii CBS 7118]